MLRKGNLLMSFLISVWRYQNHKSCSQAPFLQNYQYSRWHSSMNVFFCIFCSQQNTAVHFGCLHFGGQKMKLCLNSLSANNTYRTKLFLRLTHTLWWWWYYYYYCYYYYHYNYYYYLWIFFLGLCHRFFLINVFSNKCVHE